VPKSHQAQVANAVSSGYDALTSFLEDIELYLHELSSFGTYQTSIPNVPQLRAVLVDIFGVILDLCATWIKYMKSHRLGEERRDSLLSLTPLC
jgi:hypothetical protein